MSCRNSFLQIDPRLCVLELLFLVLDGVIDGRASQAEPDRDADESGDDEDEAAPLEFLEDGEAPLRQQASDELQFKMAVGVGFEPTVAVTPRRFSKPVHSTTLPPHRRSQFPSQIGPASQVSGA